MSIYEHILKHIPKGKPGLPPEGLALPGVPAEALGSPFAPGAREHLALYAGVPPTLLEPARRAAILAEIEVAAAAVSATREPTEEAILRLEAALDQEDPLGLVDEAMDRIGNLAIEDWEPLYDALSGIALGTDRPGALKLAMALLGPFQEEETIPFYRVLARHPEFSLYATTALANDASPAARVAIVQLLDETVGWAKVDVLERLLRIDDLEIDEVLLTKAMDAVEPVGGFVALGVADRCDLAGALEARGLTRDTLAGACRLLAQLARDAVEGTEGIPGTLDDYEDADRALEAFRERLPGGPADLDMAEAAAAVADWARARGREDLAEDAEVYLERPDVVGAVVSELGARDPGRRHHAAALAARARIEDALSTLLESLEARPDEDIIAQAAIKLARGADLEHLRDRIAARVSPESRTGEKATDHVLDPAARWVWQWIALIEALPRIPDETSRALLRTATHDRDPSVRHAAFQSLRVIESEDPRDRTALRSAVEDPVREIAREAKPTRPAPRKASKPDRPKSKPARAKKKPVKRSNARAKKKTPPGKKQRPKKQ